MLTGLPLLDRRLPKASQGVAFVSRTLGDALPLLFEALHATISSGGHAVYFTGRTQDQVREDYVRLGHPTDAFDRAVRVQPPGAPADRTGNVPSTFWEFPSASGAAARFTPPKGSSLWMAASSPADVPDGFALVRVEDRSPSGLVHPYLVAPDGTGLPLMVERPGGARIHVGKVVVTGAHNSGKSTFVESLDPKAVHIDRQGTTVGLDRARATRHGVLVDLHGTPGQERFDPLIQQAASGALGAIVVVDSTRPATFARSRRVAQTVGSGGVPVVWAANKQDLPGALEPAEVARRLDVKPRDVLGMVATQAPSCTGVLDAVLERILGFSPTA